MRGRLDSGDRSGNGYWGMVLDAPDPRGLARFYAGLLGWAIVKDEPDWVTIAPEHGVAYVAFQHCPSYVRPVWPAIEGAQQMMAHLDIEVVDLDVAVEDAVAAGATVAGHQPQPDVRVLLDPAGHPFCLYLGS